MDECGRTRVHDNGSKSPPPRDGSPKRSSDSARPPIGPIGSTPNPVTIAKDTSWEDLLLMKLAKWLGPLHTGTSIEVTQNWHPAHYSINWFYWPKPLNDFLTSRGLRHGKYNYAAVVGFFLLRLMSGYHDASYPLQLLLERLVCLRRQHDYSDVEVICHDLREFLKNDSIPEHFWSLLEDHIVGGIPFVDIEPDSNSPKKYRISLYYSNFFNCPAITNERWASKFRLYERKTPSIPNPTQ